MNFWDGLIKQRIAIGAIHTNEMIKFIVQQFANGQFCMGLNLTLRRKFTKKVNLTVSEDWGYSGFGDIRTVLLQILF